MRSLTVFFFSIGRRHTRCALVTGVRTCALPILPLGSMPAICNSSSINAGATGLGKKARVLLREVMAFLTAWNVWSGEFATNLALIFNMLLLLHYLCIGDA